MKYIVIRRNRIPVSDEVYTKIKNQERYEERLIERLSDNEILIGDEKELDKLRTSEEQTPYDVFEQQEVLTLVFRIIDTYLSPGERYVLTAFYLNDKSQREIAKETGLKIRQIKYLLKNSLKKVKEIYDRMN